MASKRTKLELTWIGKEHRPRLEPRVLVEEPERSYHAARRVSEQDHFDNRLIFGDNLLALKALEQEFTGQVKCIYIDPPYNTGSAFDHYDDGIEHSLWLSLMRDRLELLKKLLRNEGSIWINIDDNEAHYLKVLCDEVFGRGNFITTIVWQKKYAGKADSEYFSEFHEYILVYAKNAKELHLNGFERTAEQDSRYKNPDKDPRGVWQSDNLLRTEARDYAIYPIVTPSGKEYWPPKGSSWRYNKEKIATLIEEDRIWFGAKGSNMPRLKRFLTDVRTSLPPTTWWPHTDAGHNSEGKKEILALFADQDDVFATPKPERLLKRVVHIATDPGDLVLDSFAGSGTTGAVAHKMGRRWIMVELGEHCHTHIIPRMKKVIDGEDPGGVTEAVGWKGGGGFRYYRLAPSLLERDEWGNWVIRKEFNAAMLAEAVCKLEGFTYAPSETVWWQHGQSTENDFLYVTTQTLSRAQLEHLSEEVGSQRTLMVYCGAYRGKTDAWDNLTVKKIPQTVLKKCEWDKDDYSLEIAALPPPPPPEAETEPKPILRGKARRKAEDEKQGELF